MYACGGHRCCLGRAYKAQPSSVSSCLWVEALFVSWLLAISCQIGYFSFLRKSPLNLKVQLLTITRKRKKKIGWHCHLPNLNELKKTSGPVFLKRTVAYIVIMIISSQAVPLLSKGTSCKKEGKMVDQWCEWTTTKRKGTKGSTEKITGSQENDLPWCSPPLFLQPC